MNIHKLYSRRKLFSIPEPFVDLLSGEAEGIAYLDDLLSFPTTSLATEEQLKT